MSILVLSILFGILIFLAGSGLLTIYAHRFVDIFKLSFNAILNFLLSLFDNLLKFIKSFIKIAYNSTMFSVKAVINIFMYIPRKLLSFFSRQPKEQANIQQATPTQHMSRQRQIKKSRKIDTPKPLSSWHFNFSFRKQKHLQKPSPWLGSIPLSQQPIAKTKAYRYYSQTDNQTTKRQ